MLVAIDDVQWLDAESVRTLAFVFRRLDGIPVDVEALLDKRFPTPMWRALRSRVLVAAAGNPLYAIELVAARHEEDSLTVPARLEDC